ncbi:cysteate synthase [Odoribacter sp. OttesenSCG-928-L07]|nr:cysteate synthase [Odoribacter sp. OttesenSCG-928-L07]MDL2238675.1 cysteate synthase [Bacteroidales bacterium OttesenSCG-928-L14]
MQINPTKYKLINVATNREFDDAGWLLDDPMAEKPSLIRTVYEKKQLFPKDNSYGIYKFADWLPISRMMQGSCAPVTFKSKGLAEYLKLDNLFITFSGYFPTIGANMTSCSFKETEAYSVCGRITTEMKGVLVVASAGNTARAFAKVCSDNNIPLLLCVPEDNLNALWFDKPLNDCVKLICSKSGCDYFDAIHLGNIAVKSDKYYAEGGAKNVARRDGMATTMLSATTFIGEIPNYYFQAVGSGTGAIAAWEANLRLIADGRFSNKKAKLMLSQNLPFIPMIDAWNADSRELLPFCEHEARKQVEEIDAKVLSNRKPPYGVTGGLFDAMKDTQGEFFAINNDGARKAAELFEKLEGIDIHPAAAVATASLIQAAKENKIDKSQIIMLNITGGGENLFKKTCELHYLKPNHIFEMNPNENDVLKVVEGLF